MVCAQVDEARSEWAHCGNDNVLLFDPTHSTNRYGMKLCFFVTVGCSGQSVVLAFCLIKHEDVNDILWAFRKFAEVFRFPPATLFTDGDAAISAAFAAMRDCGVWKDTVHLLCVYHLSKNFFQKVHPILAHSHAEWKAIFSAFWNLAKVSDLQCTWEAEAEETSCVTFDGLWDAMVKRIKDNSRGSTKPAVIQWLKSHLFERKAMWAYCYTWSHRSWGVHSTQRSEATNSQLKRRRSLANKSLVALCDNVAELNLDARRRKDVDGVRQHLRQVGQSFNSPELTRLSGLITPYAIDLMRSQAAQASFYLCESTDDVDDDGLIIYKVTYTQTPNDAYTLNLDGDTGTIKDYTDQEDFGIGERCNYITHRCTLNSCSCQLLNVLGIPCRHMIYLRSQQSICSGQLVTPFIQLIGRKWHQRTASQARTATIELMKAARPFTAAQPARSSTIPRGDRFTSLLEALRGLAEIGAESMQAYTTLMAELPTLADKLKTAQSSRQPGCNQASGSSSASAAPVATPATSADDEAPPPVSTPSKRNDPMSFRKDILQHNHKPKTPLHADIIAAQLEPMSDEGKDIVGWWVALKFKGKRQGGWMSGKITDQCSALFPYQDTTENELEYTDGDNFVVAWQDGFTMPVELDTSRMIKVGEEHNDHDIGAWMFITDPDEDDDVAWLASSGMLRNPQDAKRRKAGRLSHKRLRPHSGPTSGAGGPRKK